MTKSEKHRSIDRIMAVVLITVFSMILMASVSVFSWGSKGTPCVGCHTVFDTTVQVSASVSELYVTAGEESSAFTVTVTGAGYDKGYTQAALRVPEGWGAGGDFIKYAEDRDAPVIWDSYYVTERGDPDHIEAFTGTIIVPSDAEKGDYTVQIWGAGCDETKTKASDMVPITIHVTPPVVLVHDIAVTGITAPSTATEGDLVSVVVDLANTGDYDEFFDLNFLVDGSVVETRSVTLVEGATTSETFTWTAVVGTHILAAEAVVADDATPANNYAETSIDVSPVVLVHDIAVTDVAVSPTEVVEGEEVSITVDLLNEGTVEETFDVGVYYDSVPIEIRTGVSLAAGATTTLTFSWDTAGVAEGTYTISAEAIVAVDDDPTDNMFTDGTVTVSPPAPVASAQLMGVGRKPGSVLRGNSVTLKARVKNTGTLNVTFYVEFVINSTMGEVATVSTTEAVEYVGDGPLGVSTSWLVPVDASAGIYTVEATLYYKAVDSPTYITGNTLTLTFKVR